MGTVVLDIRSLDAAIQGFALLRLTFDEDVEDDEQAEEDLCEVASNKILAL